MDEDEEFFAWLDGELDGAAAERVAQRVARSPELTARAEQHRRMMTGLRQAFHPVVAASATPPRFGSAEVVDFGARAAVGERGRRRFGVPQWAAMAATLALGFFAGSLIGDGELDSPVAVASGRMVAAKTLDQALDTRLASAPAAEGVRIGLTFRDSSGRICRSFTDAATRGLACREGEEWRIRGLFQAAEGQTGPYRMAAGEDPRLAALIDEAISGEPFDAAKEHEALKQGWR
jgi:hypothetical protein